ncbi:MAG: hypothetical protein Q9202_002746 [Teloschistes flavicans]
MNPDSEPETPPQIQQLPPSNQASTILLQDTIKLDASKQDIRNRLWLQSAVGKRHTGADLVKWTSKQPFRHFTALSARALAMTLASQENPERYLCPYMASQRKENVGHETQSGNGILAKQEVRDRQDKSPHAQPPPSPAVAGHSSIAAPFTPLTSGAICGDRRENMTKAAERKDPKSFAQNLFDTKVVRSFYDDSPFQHCIENLSSQESASSTGTDVRKQVLGHTVERFTDPTMNSIKTGKGLHDVSTSSASQEVNSQPLETLSHFSCRNVQSLYGLSLVMGTQQVRAQRADHSAAKPTSTVHSGHKSVKALQVSPLRFFARQSIVYVLSQSATLLNSFRKHAPVSNSANVEDPIEFHHIVECMVLLDQLDQTPSNVMPSLSVASTSLFASLTPQKKVGRTHSRTSSETNNLEAPADPTNSYSPSALDVTLQEHEAAHVALIIFAALVATIPPCSLEVFHLTQECHSLGRMVPIPEVTDPKTIQSVQKVLDAFDSEVALNLLAGLVKALSTRAMAVRKLGEMDRSLLERKRVVDYVLDWILDSNVGPFAGAKGAEPSGFEEIFWGFSSPPPGLNARPVIAYIAIVIEWLRYLVIKEWDGQMEVDLLGPAGGALDFLWDLHATLDYSSAASFQIPHLAAKFDHLKLSPDVLSDEQWMGNPKHIIGYPFVLTLRGQVSCFRAINYSRMYQAYEDTNVASRVLAQTSFPDPLTNRGEIRLMNKMGSILKNYFVIDIRRKHVLFDAMEQLWRREERELLRPLKVRMGMDEGEEGIDHGGVQQEFFRLVVAEAFNPDYGLFTTIDEKTQMTWFRPCSLEPLYKFKLLGLLFSLAIYNGLTLPVNFPLAFYRRLQGYRITAPIQIEDGWPALSKGLQSLLDWSDGDVSDVFARTYEFTVEAPAENLTIDMKRVGRREPWIPEQFDPLGGFCIPCRTTHSPPPMKRELPLPSSSDPSKRKVIPNEDASGSGSGSEKELPVPDDSIEFPVSSTPSTPAPEADMVTNENRKQYVSDYIFWLTDRSIGPQFHAFADYLFTCIAPRSFSLLNVRHLKRLVEGVQDVSVVELRSITSYDGGFTPTHPTIEDFWRTVVDFSPEQLSLLLEFVTASDRIPVTGYHGVSFSVQKNGDGDERLPTSLTCYGRLLLPEYSCREVLKEKLCLAIENSKGFGVP